MTRHYAGGMNRLNQLMTVVCTLVAFAAFGLCLRYLVFDDNLALGTFFGFAAVINLLVAQKD